MSFRNSWTDAIRARSVTVQSGRLLLHLPGSENKCPAINVLRRKHTPGPLAKNRNRG
jgi:hypothetical protein